MAPRPDPRPPAQPPEPTGPAPTATALEEAPTPAPTAEQVRAQEALLTEKEPSELKGPSQALQPRAPTRMGIAPTTLEDGWRLAKLIAGTEMIPKGYRGKPADVLVAIQFGMELGLPPMAALNSIMVTNGRPSVWGDGFLAVVMASPFYEDHYERYVVDGKEVEYLSTPDFAKDDTMAVCTFWRAGSKRPRTATFSIAQAKKAGLWTKDGPWKEYPARMLQMRAREFAGRDTFPDVLRGILTTETARDLPPEPDVPAAPEPVVRRASETPTDAPKAVPVPAAGEVTLDPAHVVDVQQFMGGYTVRLSTGVQVDLTAAQEPDALELEKFKGTDHKVRLTVAKDEKALHLTSFGIAE